MKKLFILTTILLLVLTGCKKEESIKEYLDMSAYENLVDQEHVFEMISIDDAVTLIKEDTGILYVGKPDCPHCQNLVPLLNEVAKENDVDTIFYLDVTDYKENNTDFDKVIDLFKNLYEGNPCLPTVLVVKDGVIIGFEYTDNSTKDDLANLIVSLKEAESLVINDYHKPVISLKEDYEDVIVYISGEKLNIEDYINIDFYKDKKGVVWFELADKDDEYTLTGVHDIVVFANDRFGGSTTIETKLLTENKEVIEALSVDGEKITLSDYDAYIENIIKANESLNKSNSSSAGLAGANSGGTNTTSVSVDDDLANSIVNNSAYYGYGCEAIAGVYHGLGGNDILYQGVSQVSSPQKGDLIAYFDGNGNYKHTATYLGNGYALHGNWSNGKSVIASENIYSSHVYFRLGGDTPYVNAINNTAHSKSGKAGWLEGYTVGGSNYAGDSSSSSSSDLSISTSNNGPTLEDLKDAGVTIIEYPEAEQTENWTNPRAAEMEAAGAHAEATGDCSIYEGDYELNTVCNNILIMMALQDN